MFAYAAQFVPDDNGTILATFIDIPEAITFGDSADIMVRAQDALETALSARIADRRPLPLPSAAGAGTFVSLGLLASLKLAVYQAMVEKGWRKADLARELGQNPRQVDRLLNLRHASTVAQLEGALAALGRHASLALV